MFARVRIVSLVLFVLAGTLGIGCAAKKKTRSEITGSITLDGAKVEGGIISFIPEGSDSSSGFGGAIRDGKYLIDGDTGISPGKYRVEIRWAKATGEKNPNAGYGQNPDIFAEAIPEKYNAISELTAEVKAGPNTIDFALKK